MKSLEASRASAVQTMEALDSTIDEIRDAAGWRRILPQGIGGVSPGDELAPAKEQRAEVRRELDRIEEDLRESEETLECIEERMAGGSCESLMERVSRVGGTGVSHIRDMFGRFNDMVTNVTMLLVAVAIENILFPILFLWGAMKCSFPVARQASRLLSGFEQDARKLKQDIRGRMTHDAET